MVINALAPPPEFPAHRKLYGYAPEETLGGP